MMTKADVSAVVAEIKYKPGFMLELKEHDGGRLYLQVSGMVAFPKQQWTGRKWAFDLSAHMTVSEIIQTAFKAFLTFEEHECREAFTYCGQRVLGPHLDLEQLAVMMEDGLISESTRGAM